MPYALLRRLLMSFGCLLGLVTIFQGQAAPARGFHHGEYLHCRQSASDLLLLCRIDGEKLLIWFDVAANTAQAVILP
jgi:serine protease